MDNRSFNLSDEYPPRKENGNYITENGNFRYPVEITHPEGKNEGISNRLAVRHDNEIQKSDESTDYMCGAFNRYPKWLQRFADPRWFLLAYCIQNIIAGAEGTFLIGCTTSIEKHFQFSSGDFGLLMLLSEIGPIIMTIFLSFFGGRGNRPKWLAIGNAIGGTGVLLIFSTFLIYQAPVLSESGLLDDSKKYCDIQDVINFQFLNSTSTTSSLGLASYSVEGEQTCGQSNTFVFFVWLVGFTCKTLSGTIIFTIGAPYLDDSISKNASPVYFAISISIRVLGPTIGFSLSALALNTYVYPGKNYGITPHDPRWVGAWWIGPLVFSILMLAYSFFISLFPRKMARPTSSSDAEGTPSKDEGVLDEPLTDEERVKTSVVPSDDEPPYQTNNGRVPENQSNNYDVNNWQLVDRHLSGHIEAERVNGHSIHQRINGHGNYDKTNGRSYSDSSIGHEIPHDTSALNGKRNNPMDKFASEKKRNAAKELMEALRRLSKNPVLVYGSLGDFFAFVAEFGMVIWIAKYQEHQFRVTKSSSTLFSGLSGTASLLLGVIGGGVWIHRFRPKGRTVAYLITLCSAVYLLSLLGLMFVSCDFQEDLPGILSTDATSVELYRGCSSGCECDLKEFIPVCVRDGAISLTYFSPCHAGCPDNSNVQNTNPLHSLPIDGSGRQQREVFYNCTCGSPSAKVTSGYCQDTCSGFLAYNIIMLIVRAFVSVGTIGGVLINMRCVAVEDKSLAIGIKTVMVSAALIANPLIFGFLIDSSCLVWEETCGGKGSCWLYNTEDFRYKLHGVSALFFFFCVICFFVVARKIGDLQLFDDDSTSSTSSSSSPSSPTSSFLFSSGPGGRRKSSLRRSLKKISRLMGRDNGISRSPGRKSEEKEDNQEHRETEGGNKQEGNARGNNSVPQVDNLPVSQEQHFPATNGKILPSRIVKTTGV